MLRLQYFVRNVIFAALILLLFLLLFEAKLTVPQWLQPAGRMHPMVLHFPIALLLLLALLPLLRKEIESTAFGKIQSFVLHLAALTAVVTALMGLFLAQEDGYASELVQWHKWTGVGVSVLAYALLVVHQNWPEKTTFFNGMLVATVLVTVIAGHFGASLTHGEDYVLAPLRAEKVAITPETPVFMAAIEPILDDKCYTCHNERKSKGDLVMTSVEQLLAGGENGPIWIPGDAKASPLVQRMHLPLEHDDHMPPEGKAQLTEQEKKLLESWIQAGADLQQPIEDLQPADTLYALVQQFLQEQNTLPKTEKEYVFEAASPAIIAELNTPFRTVQPLAFGSPALAAKIFVRQAYQPSFLEELTAVKTQLVELNLTNLPITDDELSTIAQFPNLEQLILNGTDITGARLSDLQQCENLQALALSNTAVTREHLQVLKQFPALEEVFVWNTQLEPQQLSDLKAQFAKLTFHEGYQPDTTEVLQLSPPQLKNEKAVLPVGEGVQLETKLPGAAIHYTTDGSEPDSLTSTVFDGPFPLDGYTTVKAKVFKDNWISSETASFTLFPQGVLPQKTTLVNPPNPQYQGKDPNALTDGEKGIPGNFRNPAWLAYRQKPFAATFYFGEKPRTLQAVLLSHLTQVYQYIFPPTKVEVWGSKDGEDWQLLNAVTPPQLSGYVPNQVVGVTVPLDSAAFSHYKVVAEPNPSLPNWHRGKGERGWVFVDEVLFY